MFLDADTVFRCRHYIGDYLEAQFLSNRQYKLSLRFLFFLIILNNQKHCVYFWQEIQCSIIGSANLLLIAVHTY